MRIKKKKKYETLLAYTYTEILCCSCCCLFFLIPFVPVYVLCFFVCGVCVCWHCARSALTIACARTLQCRRTAHDRSIYTVDSAETIVRAQTDETRVQLRMPDRVCAKE